jgi:hypothetical protein
MLRNVDLTGGFIGDDRPQFKQVNLDLELQYDTDQGWLFPGVQVASDFAGLELNGTASGRTFTIDGTGTLELPVLLDQLPHLFKVRSGTHLEQGSMGFTVKLVQDQQHLDVNGTAVVESIRGTAGQRSFSWNSPLKLTLDGSLADREARIRDFTLQAPFLHLQGAGDLKDFSLQGTANLEMAGQEIGRIFELGWNGSGSLQLAIASKEAGKDRYVVTTRMDVADFALSRREVVVVPTHQLSFSSIMETSGRLPVVSSEACDLSFDLSSWPGKISGTLDRVYQREGQVSARYQLQSDLQLGRLTDVLHNLEMLQRDTTLTGTLDLQASGYTEAGRLVIREFDSTVAEPVLHVQGKTYSDSSVHLFTTQPIADDDVAQAVRALALAGSETTFFATGGGYSMFDPANRRLVLRNLGLGSDLATFNVESFAVRDLLQLPATLSLKADGRADFAALTPVLQQAGLLKPGQALAGEGTFAVEFAPLESGRQAGTVKMDIKHAVVRRDDQTLIDDEPLHLSSRIQRDPLTGDIDFDQFKVQLARLALQADGRLEQSGTEPNFSCKGELTPDLSFLTTLLNRLYATDVRAAGRQQEQFSLHCPLAVSGQDKYLKMRFATVLHADDLSWSGVALRNAVMPIVMDKGVLQVTLTGALNKGALNFSPSLDFTRTPALLTLPEAERILVDVELAQPLVDGLLKRITPVLGLLARPVGRISARMDRFSWPFVDHGADQAEFSTVFNVSDIKLTTNGVLHEILGLAGIDEEQLSLEQSEITCNGARGRISCTPLKLLVADSAIMLTGTVGFDGSLDYLLEIPVTEKLVGREGYRVLEGTTLKVPVRGSIDKAVFDPDALSGAVSDLLGQAAGRAAGKVIEEQVEKILPGLLDGLLGK